MISKHHEYIAMQVMYASCVTVYNELFHSNTVITDFLGGHVWNEWCYVIPP